MRLAFCTTYFIAFCALLSLEIVIALFVHDGFVRPFVGDVLVVLLMYAFFRSFVETGRPKLLAVGVLLFAYVVELGQYFDLVSRLGLANSKTAAIVIGASFDWGDIMAYTIGFILILAGLERKRLRARNYRE